MPHTTEEKRLHANRKYHEDPGHRAKLLAGMREYGARPEVRARRKDYNYAYRIQREYGLTPNQVKEMSDKQNGRCLICGEAKRLVIDHDHVTGKVRGLLCHRCNTCLSEHENPQWKRAADAYLERSRNASVDES